MAEAEKPRVLILGGELVVQSRAECVYCPNFRLSVSGVLCTACQQNLSERKCYRILSFSSGVGFIGRHLVKHIVDNKLASKVRGCLSWRVLVACVCVNDFV